MRIQSFRGVILVALLALLLLAPALRAAEPKAETLAVPESILAKNVPPIPDSGEGLLPYENIRTAIFAGWHPSERRILIRTRFAESPQLHEIDMPMGARRQLTFYRDPVNDAAWRPNDPDQIVVSLNEGGAENFQLLLLDRKTGKLTRFTDGKSRNVSAVWSHDGKLLAWTSTARNGRDFDLWVGEPSSPASLRRVADLSGGWDPLDWSPDGRSVLMVEGISANETYLHWIDVTNGQVHDLTPRRRGDAEPVAYEGGVWSPDGKAIYTTSDLGSEFLRLVRIDLATGKQTVVSGDTPWDVETFDRSDDGKRLAYFVNEDGFSRLHILELPSGKELPSPALPMGQAQLLRFRPGSHEVAFAVSWARSPSDVYSYDLDTRKLERWTESEVGGLDPQRFAVPELIHYPTFDQAGGKPRQIPAYVYRPSKERFPGKRPVYINIHGGPEAQARPGFLGSNNYLLDELGVAYVVPNVRGSAGYGKTYLKLDNGELREDSVKDIGSLLDWIATQPDLDASRVMVSGGSYGGYMTLAVLVHYSDRLRGGYESVGISNFVTFLENTSEYRRDLRRVEYGDERDPKMRAFLESIAPVKQVDKITVPLLVAQGANDPRVPLSESDQIVAALSSRNVPAWYVVAKDEGHGFGKKTNTDYLRAVMMEFIREYLLAGPGGR